LRQVRQQIAAVLAAVAVLGLVVTPVVHSELHFREAQAERQSALAIVFALGFQHTRTPAQEHAFKHAVAHAFGSQEGKPVPGVSSPHDDQPQHQHSHGSKGPHGAGSLEHGGAALRPAEAPAQLAVHRVASRLAAFSAPSIVRTPRYSTPRNSQAPPAA